MIMRVVLQRVSRARVLVDDRVVGEIGPGLCLLVGVGHDDSRADVDVMAAKIAGLRVFSDAEGKMNLNVGDVGGAALVVSQFTLLGDVRKGRRPSFTAAGEPSHAEPLVDYFAESLRREGVPVSTGVFGAKMGVDLTNDGPVTLVVEVKRGVVV